MTKGRPEGGQGGQKGVQVTLTGTRYPNFGGPEPPKGSKIIENCCLAGCRTGRTGRTGGLEARGLTRRWARRIFRACAACANPTLEELMREVEDQVEEPSNED